MKHIHFLEKTKALQKIPSFCNALFINIIHIRFPLTCLASLSHAERKKDKLKNITMLPIITKIVSFLLLHLESISQPLTMYLQREEFVRTEYNLLFSLVILSLYSHSSISLYHILLNLKTSKYSHSGRCFPKKEPLYCDSFITITHLYMLSYKFLSALK